VSKRLLVTGGAGFIGSRFVHHTLDRYPDYEILVLDALTYAGSIDNIPLRTNPRCRFFYGNVCNADLVSTLAGQCDYIVHFAAETHVSRSIYDNRLFFETDVLGTQSVANALVKHGGRVERLIHVSTSEVYGNAIGAKMDEDHPLLPTNPYAAAKCGADRLVYSYISTYRIPAVIVRPFNSFGPGQHLEKLIPRFITSALLNEPLTVHGDGRAARDYLYVFDLCRALDMILHAPADRVEGQVFNVCSGEHRAIGDIADDIMSAMAVDPSRKVTIEDRPGQVVRHTGDYGKIQRTLGWTPSWTWPDALAATIEWFRIHHGVWEKQLWMRTVEINLPDGRIYLY
jgi:dTDP-glucose 4,6-dehydratase